MHDYFNNLTTEEAKVQYKALYRANCGDKELMQEINAQFALCAQMNTITATMPEPTDQGAGVQAHEQVITDKAKFAATLPGCNVEICGTWVWVTGGTKTTDPHHEENRKALQGEGFRFSGKKSAWYYTAKPIRYGKKGIKTQAQVRMKYGSEPVQAEML